MLTETIEVDRETAERETAHKLHRASQEITHAIGFLRDAMPGVQCMTDVAPLGKALAMLADAQTNIVRAYHFKSPAAH